MLDDVRFRRRKSFVSLLLVLIIAAAAWHILHQTPRILPDVYPYLSSLPAQMVLRAQGEGESLGPEGWASLLAIRSTVPTAEAGLVAQLKKGRAFEKLDWAVIQPDKAKLVKYRRYLLLRYPYYKPNEFVFPVPAKSWYENSFGANREGGKRQHEGTDLFSPEGTPIISVCAGKVERLGWNRLGGERVGIRGEDGNYYYYAHLETLDARLREGMRVEKGQALGTMGHTGDALTTPDHLHFGIELPNGEWLNPFPFLKVWELTRLASQSNP